MTGKEAKEIFIKHYEKKFNELGFFIKKNRTIDIIFSKPLENGFEEFYVSTLDYNPVRVFQVSTGKRIESIEEVLLDLSKEIVLSNNEFINKQIHEKTAVSLYYNYASNNVNLCLSEIARNGTELEVITSGEIILNYIREKVLPAYSSFDTISNIDNIINGENENLWLNDGGNNRPFTLAHLFYPRRLTIARLCKSDIEYDNFIERFYGLIDSQLLKENRSLMDRSDNTISTNFIIKYLKENIRV